MKKVTLLISLIVCMVLVSAPAFGGGFKKSKGQTVYVPASHNCQWPYWKDGAYLVHPIDPDHCSMTTNSRIIIRNVDLKHSITVTDLIFHDPDGQPDEDLSSRDMDEEIPALASKTYALPADTPYWSVFFEGRPSVIVKWTADRAVHPPSISSAIVIVNRAPPPGLNPFTVDALSIMPGIVLNNQP